MQLGRISRQRAVAICRAENLSFRQLQEETGLLLKTGAKLYCRRWTTCPAAEWEYYIGGYAQDGSDITPYLKIE